MRPCASCWIILLACGVTFPAEPEPTDPLATAETKALYRNLCEVTQKGILLAHQNTLAYGVGWKAGANDFDSDVHRVCGKFPAVFGWDLGHIGTPACPARWKARGHERRS